MSKTGRPDFTGEDAVTQDQAQGISLPHRLSSGVDRLFLPYSKEIKLSDYWTLHTLQHGFWGFFSKRHFQYGWFYLRAQLATMGATRQLFGLEGGPGLPPTACWLDIHAANAYFNAGPHGPALDVTMHLPANYDTAENKYMIKVNQNNLLLWINGRLRAIHLLGIQQEADIPVWDAVAPYCLGGNLQGAAAGPLFVGMEGADYIEWKVYPNTPVAFDGTPILPLTLALYTESAETIWDDLVINAGSVTSHPIPIGGYDKKTIFFRANGAGNLDVQVYLINAWRTVSDIAIIADTLDIEVFDFESPIVRYVFTPTAYPTTITEAVASLN